jgi:hypothetical protein
VAPHSRLAACSVRSEHNRCQAFVNLVAGPGMGYGAYVAPFLLHCDATAMRAACVQMCHAIERVPAWPTPVALRTLDLSDNPIGDAGALALAASLRVRQRPARLVVFDAWCVLVCVPLCLICSRSMRIGLVFR